MVDSLGGVLNRIEEIQKGIKNIGAFSKPEKVKEFENMLKEKLALSDTESVSGENQGYHPFLHDVKEPALDKVTAFDSSRQISKQSVDNSYYSNRQQMINDAISKASGKYGISPGLINAVIKVESAYDPDAVSHAGAMGLMQLMPQTAQNMGVENPFDIYQNIDGGTRYLRLLLDQYQGDLDKTLSAYNAGPQRVQQYNGVPDIEETQNYVLKVKNNYFK